MTRSLRVVQVTDSHVFADPSATLKNVCTDRSLRRVLAHAREHASPADLVLATGDLTDDGSREGYERLKRHLRGLGAPVAWVPGNHDEADVMRATLAGDGFGGPGTRRIGAWSVVLLDSVVPGEDGGHLSAAELERLNAALSENPGGHALVALHHPPVQVGTPNMDAIALANRDEFFAVIDRHRCVRGILWGHFHHAFDERRGSVRLMGTPSTCYQMRLGGEEVVPDDVPPGYRRLDLTHEGGIRTDILRVP
ncbi:MAG: phosphodiesterase [Gammaproteobacteria bacterium]|nr:phosphodiesterase [Gammaproteobacteria bacterium]NIR82864.1 phosphodiesterase [Gammaproteobacteria bacterium]NIR89973.1 phosphodiesterase [Gammaproteobacteria bacterium]NIU04022.1 phosphodiesterase [Gammaproteobacteria bacterium]NIV51342.1 phosphodiesterase [Gammaproteobacteria bacterium]